MFKGATNPYVIDCGIRMASSVTIIGGMIDEYLNICEVEVLSSRPPGRLDITVE